MTKPDLILRITGSRLAVLNTSTGMCRVLKRSGQLDIASAVSAALKDFPCKKASTAVVLASDFFTQTVRLGLAQARSLSDDELLSVLAFEVEPFSSIPRDMGKLAYVAGENSGEYATWNVVQIANTELAAMTTRARGCGVKVIGVGYADNAFPEEDNDAAKEALLRCSEELGSENQPFPMVSAGSPNVLALRGIWPSVIATAVVAIACLCHFGIMSAIAASRQREATKLDGVANEVERINAAVHDCEKRARDVEDGNIRRIAVIRRMGLYHTAWLSFFRALPSACGDPVCVRSITSPQPFHVQINAFSSVENGPYSCMDRLSTTMKGFGWTIFPESASTMNAMGKQGPVQFVFGAVFEEMQVKPQDEKREVSHAEAN